MHRCHPIEYLALLIANKFQGWHADMTKQAIIIHLCTPFNCNSKSENQWHVRLLNPTLTPSDNLCKKLPGIISQV